MPDHALITIGITCFNAQDTIDRAIRSALGQDWPSVEVIVVDDGSSDSSAVLVEKLAANNPRLRFVRHTVNRGPGAARNSILAQSKGQFVAFFDDDDESLPERVRSQYGRLREYEAETGVSLLACYASGLRRYPNGYELHMAAIGSQASIPTGEMVADYLLFNARKEGVFYGSGTPTCALMASCETFQIVGGFDERMRRVEDVDFAVRLALKGGHFIGCSQHLFLQHATMSSDKTPYKNLTAELQLIEKHASYLKRRHRYRYAHDWFHIRYFHFSGQRIKFIAALIGFLLHYPLTGVRHLFRSFPARWNHERKMRALAAGDR